MKPTVIKHKFIEQRAKGLSFSKISRILNISRQTLIDWNKEFEIEIANLKALELEELVSKYHLYREARIESIGIIMNKLKNELTQRDFSDLGTDKILEIYLKYENQLNAEVLKPVFQTTSEIEDLKSLNQFLGSFNNNLNQK